MHWCGVKTNVESMSCSPSSVSPQRLWGTSYCVWSDISSFSNLNRSSSSSSSLLPRSVEKRPRRLRLEIKIKRRSKHNILQCVRVYVFVSVSFTSSFSSLLSASSQLCIVRPNTACARMRTCVCVRADLRVRGCVCCVRVCCVRVCCVRVRVLLACVCIRVCLIMCACVLVYWHACVV